MPSPEENTVKEETKEEPPRVEPLPPQVQALPPRETTQTDHINKKLLTSLFNRLDEGGECLGKMLEEDNKTVEEDEWYD